VAKIASALGWAILILGTTIAVSYAGGAVGRAADVAEIKSLRLANNRAIAAHDLKAFTPMFADDAVFIWSNGTTAVGKAELEKRFTGDFADPAFITYVRTPERISVSDTGVRAVEHGTWTALKHNAQGDTRYGGDYAAHWAKDDKGWHVRGELYVKLRCTGPLCTP
jgi:ketosteroid isomerase-like protein